MERTSHDTPVASNPKDASPPTTTPTPKVPLTDFLLSTLVAILLHIFHTPLLHQFLPAGRLPAFTIILLRLPVPMAWIKWHQWWTGEKKVHIFLNLWISMVVTGAFMFLDMRRAAPSCGASQYQITSRVNGQIVSDEAMRGRAN